MKKNILGQLLVLVLVLMVSGCARVRTYTVTKDRVDQDLTAGNQGYISGKIPQTQVNKERKTTRTTYVTEIELPPYQKPAVKPKPEAKQSQQTATSDLLGVKEPDTLGSKQVIAEQKTSNELEPATETMEKYTVQKADTLQKISKKFYGTTKKWKKILNANKGILKAANKIYPGQIINVPVQKLKEPAENLK